MTVDLADLTISLAAGVIIGGFYFYGLWWTVRGVMDRGSSPLWTPVSFLVRSALALAGFYWVMAGRWENLIICVAGFSLVRFWLMRRMRPARAQGRTGPGDL